MRALLLMLVASTASGQAREPREGRDGSRRAVLAAPATSSFSPSSLANLSMWLRADLGVTSSSNRVSAWADQSAGGKNATQGTGGNQPLLVASGIGSKPTVRFLTSRGDIMSVVALNQNLAFRVYLIGNFSGVGAFEGLLDASSGQGTDRVDGKPGYGANVTAGAVTGNHLITIEAYANGSVHALQNQTRVRVDNGAFSSSLGSPGLMQSNFNLLGSADMDLSELIVAVTDGSVDPVTSAEDTALLTYFSSRYGLW